jgi:itaconyl-CoA hydratase
MNEELRGRATKIFKGHRYEDFEPGRVFQHHWGRTITVGDNTLFTTLTMSFNPLYFNVGYARAHGHGQIVVNPMLVFLVVFGLSVEDLSEAGGLFLGVDDLSFHRTVYPGQTLFARSTVVDRRESASRPETGIVTWHTEGFLLGDEGKSAGRGGSRGKTGRDGEIPVVDFRRTNLVTKRGAGL